MWDSISEDCSDEENIAKMKSAQEEPNSSKPEVVNDETLRNDTFRW
jgi:hypothetical protein